MKTILLIAGIVITFSACNSKDKEKKEDTKTNHEVGVQNVNGNIPDTSNAIELTHQLDTLGKGSESAK